MQTDMMRIHTNQDSQQAKNIYWKLEEKYILP